MFPAKLPLAAAASAISFRRSRCRRRQKPQTTPLIMVETKPRSSFTLPPPLSLLPFHHPVPPRAELSHSLSIPSPLPGKGLHASQLRLVADAPDPLGVTTAAAVGTPALVLDTTSNIALDPAVVHAGCDIRVEERSSEEDEPKNTIKERSTAPVADGVATAKAPGDPVKAKKVGVIQCMRRLRLFLACWGMGSGAMLGARIGVWLSRHLAAWGLLRAEVGGSVSVKWVVGP